MIELIKDIWAYLLEGKRIYMIPIFLALVIIGLFLVVAPNPAIAPLIYVLW
jgi:hypothetical protein|tara:strand:- start:184 stop:336 length:153 start_codon:yes stop_codon:yes gene_type:complete